MSELYEYLCLLAVTGWVLSRLLGMRLSERQAVVAGLAVAAAVLAAQAFWPATAMLSAVFSPVSLGVAALAAADLARPFGLRARRRPALELAAALIAYPAYLAASIGVVGFDPHAFGYGGAGPAVAAIGLGAYALARRDLLLAAIVAGAQLAWLADFGSENLFDHLAGVLLIPALLVGLYRRARGR